MKQYTDEEWAIVRELARQELVKPERDALRRIADMAFEDPSQPLRNVASIAREALAPKPEALPSEPE
jgi:hypothetical protein